MENGNYGYIKPVLLRPRLLSGLSLAALCRVCAPYLPRVLSFQNFPRVNLLPRSLFSHFHQRQLHEPFLLLKNYANILIELDRT